VRYITGIVVVLLFTIHCKRISKEQSVSDEPEELLIYCENSMVQPLLELKSEFEDIWNCEIIIHNDCSQNLISLIQYSLKGDLYMPGSKNGFTALREKHNILITDSVFIGYNPIVLMVERHNPNQYSGDLKSLIANNRAIIIANPETSSLGYETQKILNNEDVYNNLLDNVVSLSVDSRGLIKSVYDKQAQVAISWRSDIYSNIYASELDIIAIPKSDESPPEVYVGLLSSVKNIHLAEVFLNYIAGERARIIFKKYGVTQQKSIVF